MATPEKSLAELAQHLNANIHGNPQTLINSMATLQDANSGQIAFLDNVKYRKYLPTTKASAVILHKRELENCPCAALVVDNPYLAFAKAAELFAQLPKVKSGIHATAVIGEGCEIDPTASIGPHVVIGDHSNIGAQTIIEAGCVIGERCQIGSQCHLYPGVTIYYACQLKNQIILHSGSVIGADGFGFAEVKGIWHKVPQLGRVIIEDNVEIGANTTIDRGALADTLIGKGVKLDNQIQIGHNVQIGDHTIIAGCTGIAGSAKIGKYCRIGGGVGINGHLEIADYVAITASTTINHSITEPGIYSNGMKFMKAEDWRKNAARITFLDKNIREIKQRLTSLENKQKDEA